MPISILPPAPALPIEDAPSEQGTSSDDDSDVPMGGSDPLGPRINLSKGSLVTPGEQITSDTQWMRGHGTYPTPGGLVGLRSTVAGRVQVTNKLVSVSALRARYDPNPGDTVVGRIVEVQNKRWKVEIGAPLLARLELSSINLPGGALRRRTGADELQMRAFFAEGDLLVAEVRGLNGDGSANIHTRSLRYGKLRNGMFLAIPGAGGVAGGGGVVKSPNHIWEFAAGNGAGELAVYLGLNGYVFIAKVIEALSTAAAKGEAGGRDIAKLEEHASGAVYSSQNEELSAETRTEIVRVAECIRALIRHGATVNEDMIMRAYHAALELEMGTRDDDIGGEGKDYLGGERGKLVVDMALESAQA